MMMMLEPVNWITIFTPHHTTQFTVTLVRLYDRVKTVHLYTSLVIRYYEKDLREKDSSVATRHRKRSLDIVVPLSTCQRIELREILTVTERRFSPEWVSDSYYAGLLQLATKTRLLTCLNLNRKEGPLHPFSGIIVHHYSSTTSV